MRFMLLLASETSRADYATALYVAMNMKVKSTRNYLPYRAVRSYQANDWPGGKIEKHLTEHAPGSYISAASISILCKQ